MRTSHRSLPAVLLAAVCLPAQANCVRHFNNRSSFTWSIAGYDGMVSKLLIPPGTTVEIPYGVADKLTISGNIPDRPFTKQFQVQALGDCYEILHHGNPGYITLNKTQNGDVVTCTGDC